MRSGLKSPELMKVSLVRHAQSEANAGKRTSDPQSIPITLNGRQKALEFAKGVIHPPDLIIVTSYVRTVQSAEPLIKRFPKVSVEVWPLHEFTYLSPTMCINTTSQERAPMMKEYWRRCDPMFIHGLGSESFNQFANRVVDSIDKIKHLDLATVIVFTHGQVMRFFKQYLEHGCTKGRLSMKVFRHTMLPIDVPNLGVFEIKIR